MAPIKAGHVALIKLWENILSFINIVEIFPEVLDIIHIKVKACAHPSVFFGNIIL